MSVRISQISYTVSVLKSLSCDHGMLDLEPPALLFMNAILGYVGIKLQPCADALPAGDQRPRKSELLHCHLRARVDLRTFPRDRPVRPRSRSATGRSPRGTDHVGGGETIRRPPMRLYERHTAT